jgi:hypothetical protein
MLRDEVFFFTGYFASWTCISLIYVWKTKKTQQLFIQLINPLTPNGHYSGRTAPLTSRRPILNIDSTNIRTEYFKHAA